MQSVVDTEDRALFCAHLLSMGIPTAPNVIVSSLQQACSGVEKLGGYPVLIRAAFALGGLGSGFVNSEAELISQVELALSVSSSIIIDKDLRGWKEVFSFILCCCCCCCTSFTKLH